MAAQSPAFFCPCARRCGGCQLLHLPYAQQLAYKQQIVQRLLGSFGPVRPILGMAQPIHYRHKVQAAFRSLPDGRIVSGTYEAGSHRLVPVEHCLLENETADAILATIRALCAQMHIRPFDERTGQGVLRHVLIRKGYATGQVLVVLVTGSPYFPGSRQFVQVLCSRHPEIVGVVQNINGRYTSMVLGRQEKLLYGQGFIEDSLCGLTFRISAQSFYQVNPVQTEALYHTAIQGAGLTGHEYVLDAYCGTGTIGLAAARQAAQVLGVELNRAAVRDAAANARRNRLANIRFICADASQAMEQLAAEGQRVDVVLMDPPRAGSDTRFLNSLLHLAPSRVVYISCNPETQHRDLLHLARRYRAEWIQPIDLFPHTKHVETVVLLSKLNAKQHVETD